MKKYGDDCFAIIPLNFVERFFPFIYGINRNLLFTNEIEDNGTLCYLDVKILRQETGTIKFAIHRKTSNTARLLDYDSYTPDIQKRNLTKSLVQRTLKICSDTELSNELEFITDTWSAMECWGIDKVTDLSNMIYSTVEIPAPMQLSTFITIPEKTRGKGVQ